MKGKETPKKKAAPLTGKDITSCEARGFLEKRKRRGASRTPVRKSNWGEGKKRAPAL